MSYVGIDLGGERIHCIALDAAADLLDGDVFDAADLAAVVAWCSQADGIAIDAPARLSSAPHRDQVDARSRKFLTARCAEIDLAERFGIWVPYVTPCELTPAPKWMQVGFSLFSALEAAGKSPIEVYPHGAFRELAAGALPKKTKVAGMTARVAILERLGLKAQRLRLWSHDALDAAVAAVVARDHALGHARPAGCGHDGSTIWLPAARRER